MAKFHPDTGELPWPTKPKNLAVYVASEWSCGHVWRSARSAVAHSLGRRCLPEICAMTGDTYGAG